VKYLEILRAQRAAIEEWRSAVVDALETIATRALDEKRALDDDETAEVERLRSHVADIDKPDAELAKTNERIAELEAVEKRTSEIADRPEVHVQRKADPADVLEDRAATPGQLADAVTRSIEARVEAEHLGNVRSIVRRHLSDDLEVSDEARAWARNLIARTQPAYVRGFAKLTTGRADLLTAEERAAVSVGTSANGGWLVPTHLDPTIILTNNGSHNAIRGISRQATLVDGNVWRGVNSAGVTASFDGELAEVSDDSPTFANTAVPLATARAFVQASIEAFADINGLAADVLMLFADARDRLEGARHATGSGVNEPKGIFTALNANTNVQVTSTTAATIGLVDLHAVYRAVPVRWRNRSTWVANPLYTLAVKALGTAVSASYTADLTAAPSDRLLGRPVLECDDAPTTQTTTALDNEMVLGDFSNFVVVDKPGSMSVDFIPHLFNVANNLPDGRRGWFAYWRNGSGSVNDSAFRLLVDKTSA